MRNLSLLALYYVHHPGPSYMIFPSVGHLRYVYTSEFSFSTSARDIKHAMTNEAHASTTESNGDNLCKSYGLSACFQAQFSCDLFATSVIICCYFIVFICIVIIFSFILFVLLIMTDEKNQTFQFIETYKAANFYGTQIIPNIATKLKEMMRWSVSLTNPTLMYPP